MQNILLGIRNRDRIFTVKYKELGWKIYCLVLESRMEHLKLGIRNWDGTFTVRNKNWNGTFTVRYKEVGWNI